MRNNQRPWGLGAKLALVGTPFLLLALLSTVLTLWVSWQLDGGAAAVNEAGRMRMQAWRMALVIASPDAVELGERAREFDASLSLLRAGDAERPLFVPWDTQVQSAFTQVEADWQRFQQRWTHPLIARPPRATLPADAAGLRADTQAFVVDVDHFVAAIETHMAHWTAILHLLQMGILILAVIGAATLLFTGYLFVLEPVNALKQAIEKIQGGDLGARVERLGSDEFGTLAAGFNNMAAHLQSMYRNLESKVLEKTAELEEKRERLETLYEVTALVARATTLDELAREFANQVRRIARADGVALRWSDQANQRYLMLAASGLPTSMVEDEHCLRAGDCFCGNGQTGDDADSAPRLHVIPIHDLQAAPLRHCEQAGFSTVVNVPIRMHARQLGELALFFHAKVEPTEAERSLLEALNRHLAAAMDNLRLNALEKEAAVSGERQLIASELHDSIAQSLSFLKIQVQLMHDALRSGSAERTQAVLEEIDLGVRESLGDVRELLLHFRTRANGESIEPALQTTLRKFEHQTGLQTELRMVGDGLPLAPDLQIQVLHIVQEALSNVRKHASATRVWLEVQQKPAWRFEVRDDGAGFDAEQAPPDETHVGLRIMAERAARIGATLRVQSVPGQGSSVVLTLATPLAPQTTPQPAQRSAP